MTSCVNKLSKEFKGLCSKFNVSPNTMELLIHQYWIEKGSEDDFPTRAYLNAKLGYAPYEEHINSVIKVWDKLYSHPITFDNRAKAFKAKNNALKVFPPKAVNLHLDAKGNYILVIKKPVKDLKAAVNNVINSGSYSSMSLNFNAKTTKAYQMTVARGIFKRFNNDRTSSILADKVFNLAESLGINIRFTDMPTENLGKYIPNEGILLNKSFFSSVDNNEKKASVILHEAIHAVCDYALSGMVREEAKPQQLIDFKHKITQIYDSVKHNKALEGERGIVNVKEFVAELSNPMFREKLKSIGEVKNQSLWQRILDAFKRLFNIHSSSDYYTRSMNTLNNALNAFDRDTYMEYNGILNELRKAQGKAVYTFTDKTKAFLDSLSEEEENNITDILNREVSDYILATQDNKKEDNKRQTYYFTFDDGIQVKAPFMLNEQQAKALNIMDRFIHSNETSMTLSGYAGTGKTSLMEMLKKKEERRGVKVIFTATTNKAAAVLKSKVGDKAVTLNKAFGINVEVDSAKKYDAKNLINNVREYNMIHPGSVVVIDEASMINEENYGILNDIARNMGAKIIYVGDSAQLAPVNETRVSKVFRDTNGRSVTKLTKVERTGDNAILEEATAVRNGQGLSGISSFNKEGKGVAYVRPQQKEEIGEIVRHFAPELIKDPDSFKIIAYTNAKVAAYNTAMRKTLGYTDNVPRVGEPIMGYTNFDYKQGSWGFINSESYKVIEVAPEHKMVMIIQGNRYETTVNDVSFEDSNGMVHTYPFVDVKRNAHNRQVATVLGKVISRLWEDLRRTGNPRTRKQILDQINSINTCLFINDDIKEDNRTITPKVWDFGYAITVHKSQGSTFKNVLIDDVDIQKARRDEDDLGVLIDDYNVVDPNSMIPAGQVTMNDVHNMNGATEISSAPFSLGKESFTSSTQAATTNSDTVNLIQQLEYVAISRATDTATVLSNMTKKEGSPLHPEKLMSTQLSKPDNVSKSNTHTEPNKPISSTITQQVVDHLKSIPGINVLGRSAMETFLKTHNVIGLQQYIAKNSLPKDEVAVLGSTLMSKYGNNPSYGDVIQTANYEYIVNYKGAGEFDIIEYHQIDNNLNERINDTERGEISEAYDSLSSEDGITQRQYKSDSYNIEDRESNGNNVGLDKSAPQGKSIQSQGNDGSSQHKEWHEIKKDSATGRISFIDGDGRTVDTTEDWNSTQAFTTPQGEVYGFIDKEGNVYLDETKISPNHPIHEYTHLWDRVIQQKNPKLWQRGVELMKQTSMWNKIANDEHYGKQWQSQGLSQDKIETLIASEVHARFTGEGGEQLLNNLAKEKGQSNIIEKLKQWILDVWKDLKATFGNWSQEEINNLTIKNFNHMTVRDFAEGVNLNDVSNATYTQQQHNEPNMPTKPITLSEPIKPSKSMKVDLPGYEHFDRQVKNGKQKGIEVDAEWKVPILRELDSKIYNPKDSYDALSLKYAKDKLKERLVNDDCINKINVLLRRVHSQEEWDNVSLRNKLIKEEEEQNQYDKLARQIDNLNNPMDTDNSNRFDTPLTSSEVKHAAEMAMDYASDIITRLQAEGEKYAKEVNPDFQPKANFDFKTATRQEVIEAVGLSNIFNTVHEWFNYSNDWYDSDEAADDACNKANFLYDNWDAIMWMGATFFNFNEGFGFKEQIGGLTEAMREDNQLPHDETFNNENDEDELVELYGEGREHYLVDSRTIDTLNSMSTLVKRALHECYQLDKNNNPVVNNVWGLKERVNVKDATLSILSWTQGSVTYEDMLSKISQKAKLKKNNWVNQLLIKLNDNSGQYTDLQSQFFNVFCKHHTDYTVAIDEEGKVSSIPANKNPVLKQVMNAAKARFEAGETPLFNLRRINLSLLGNKDSITDRYTFNLHKAFHELDTLDKSLDTRVNYQRRRKALSEEQIENASDTLSRVMQSLGFNFTSSEIADILDESSLHNMVTSLGVIMRRLSKENEYRVNHPNDKSEITPFSYKSGLDITGALRSFIKPLTDSLEEVTQNTVYDNGKLYQAFTIPSFLSKLFQKFNTQDDEKFNSFLAEEYGKSEFFSLGHEFDPRLLKEQYHWRLPWLDLMDNRKDLRQIFDHRVNLSYKGKNYMKKMSDLEYAMSVLSQYWSMSSDMREDAPAYFRMPMQSNKPTEDYIGFVANRKKETYKKDIVNGKSDRLGLYHMFLTELSRIQTVRMRNKDKKSKGFIKNFDTNGRNFCFFKFLNPYLNGLSDEYRHSGYTTDLLAPKEVFDENGNARENHDDRTFAELLQKKIKGEEALTSEEELRLSELAKKAIYNYLQDRFNSILDSWQENGLIKAARNITNINEGYVSLDNEFNENSQKAEYDNREKEIDRYVRGQLENFLWNDYFAIKNILMLTVGDTAFYKDEEDLQKRLAQLHAPGLRGRVSAVDYNGKPVSDGKYRTVILKDFDKVKSNIIDNITEVFNRKIAEAPDDMKAQWKALMENVLKAYSEINVADAEGYVSPTAYRKKAIMFGKWSKEAEVIYQKISKGEPVSFTDIQQAFQPLKPFVYSHLYKTMEVGNAPITNMYCPFQAKNSEYLLVMADVLLRNEQTSRPNLLRAIFNTMEDSAFDSRKRYTDDDELPKGKKVGDIKVNGTYNGKGIDTIQFESAIKSSLQGTVDIAQYADNVAEGEKKAMDTLHDAIYKAGTQGYNSSAYNTDIFVQELPFEDYCLQQDVPDHFKDHEQAHGSQTRMIIPSDLEEYYNEDKDHNDPDNIVKYEYDDWQQDEEGSWRKVHVSKTAKEIKEEYENVIYENIASSLDNLAKELHLNTSSKVERNLALSKILQRELHSSPRYGIDLVQACTIDKVTGEFRIPKGDPIQCKRIEQLINSIIKNRVNKQLIPGGPIVQVSNFGTSRQLQIRFNDKKGKLLPTKEEYDPSKHDGKSYGDYCKENQGGIAYFEVFAPAWSEDLYRIFADENGTIDVKNLNNIDPDLLKLITYRIPTEDKCSIAPCKIVGFLPKEAGSTIMLPYELTSQDGSDFDIDKRYVMRKTLNLVPSREKITNMLYKKVAEGKKLSDEKAEEVKKDIAKFLDVINSDHSYTAKFLKGGKVLNDKYNELKAGQDWKKVFTTARPKARDMRNNKIIDLSWSILTNPATADKVLKPEGFDEQKKVGYMIAAYRNNPDLSWDELEQIANGEKGIENLKSLSYIEKDLAFFDTQLQFYKQNAAAASLIGVFAVNKIAHSTLEGDGIYLDVPKGTTSFTIGHKVFMKDRMELDPRFDTEGNNIGNILGSLVGASADAVKDPILNLMNVNMNTANILNALLRLGMSFKEAAMFLSQSVITKALAECDKQNLERYASIGKVIGDMIKDMDNKNHYTSDSNIHTEEISSEELVEGLLDGDHEALDYKVLVAFQKILDIADLLRKPTLVTRFNSIAGAVGPLVVDNLMTQAKLSDFDGEENTGFVYKDERDEWQPATFETILSKHPILAGFYNTYDLANNLLGDTPAGSAGFRRILNSLGTLKGSVMRDRQLLDSLVNFYTSFLLIDHKLIDSSMLGYYVKDFPMEFNKVKESGKYKGNMLVDSITLGKNNKSSNPFLEVNTTGMDIVSKEKLSSAWIDLYNADKTLALKLFAYNFFKGGLQFSPKTFTSLLPNYIKERIVKHFPDGSQTSYVDIFRKLSLNTPASSTVIDQFVRNNWSNNKLVPFIKKTNEMSLMSNTMKVVSNEDKANCMGKPYIKIKVGKNMMLFKYDKENSDNNIMTYKAIQPLGNNGEYIEISSNDIVHPLTPVSNVSNSISEAPVSDSNLVADGTTELTQEVTQDNTESSNLKDPLSLVEMFMEAEYDKGKANFIINNYKRNVREYDRLTDAQYKLLRGVFEKQGLKLNDKEAYNKFKEMC